MIKGPDTFLSYLKSNGAWPMPDIEIGQEVEAQGSSAKPYIMTHTGDVYACTCPAWRSQSLMMYEK